MSAVRRLRAETVGAHDAVDTAYTRFDLTDPTAYRAFLQAHALALPAVEQALAGSTLPPWRGRAGALAADLAALGAAMPAPLPLDPPGSDAAAWGMLYVIEGSRLGGVMLERQVAADLPRAYLSARHLPGEWRRLLAALDDAGRDDGWIDRALGGARRTFQLYGIAAGVRAP